MLMQVFREALLLLVVAVANAAPQDEFCDLLVDTCLLQGLSGSLEALPECTGDWHVLYPSCIVLG